AVSTGDEGYNSPNYPAMSFWVTSVGGTTLAKSGNGRGWTEKAWSLASSACSKRYKQIKPQTTALTGCTKRATADVAAVADNVAVYDTYNVPSGLSKGWNPLGGTRAAAPIIAGVFGLAANGSPIDNTYPYAHTSALFDITGGNNGKCPTKQWCTAGKGWDGPTGLGTPNGIGAF